MVGYLSAVSIKEAYRIVQRLEPGDSQGLSYDPEPVAARCGVSRIWVAESHRRNKIATRLLDCLRKHFSYGEPIGLDKLAFSVPTAVGQQLAAAYTKTEQFLIYW